MGCTALPEVQVLLWAHHGLQVVLSRFAQTGLSPSASNTDVGVLGWTSHS